jgi:hypothetical protein
MFSVSEKFILPANAAEGENGAVGSNDSLVEKALLTVRTSEDEKTSVGASCQY